MTRRTRGADAFDAADEGADAFDAADEGCGGGGRGGGILTPRSTSIKPQVRPPGFRWDADPRRETLTDPQNFALWRAEPSYPRLFFWKSPRSEYSNKSQRTETREKERKLGGTRSGMWGIPRDPPSLPSRLGGEKIGPAGFRPPKNSARRERKLEGTWALPTRRGRKGMERIAGHSQGSPFTSQQARRGKDRTGGVPATPPTRREKKENWSRELDSARKKGELEPDSPRRQSSLGLVTVPYRGTLKGSPEFASLQTDGGHSRGGKPSNPAWVEDGFQQPQILFWEFPAQEEDCFFGF